MLWAQLRSVRVGFVEKDKTDGYLGQEVLSTGKALEYLLD